MKILKEAKENLPLSFLTVMVSKGWDEVGILKEQKEAINKTFKGTAKIEKLLQDLIDAHLVCIGQVEQLIQDKKYLDFPEAIPTDQDNTEIKENLKEDITICIKEDPQEEIAINGVQEDHHVGDTSCLGLINSDPVNGQSQNDFCNYPGVPDYPDANFDGSDDFELNFDDVFNCEFAAPNPADKITDEDLYPEN